MDDQITTYFDDFISANQARIHKVLTGQEEREQRHLLMEEKRKPKAHQRPDFTEYTAYHGPFAASRPRRSVRFGMDRVPDVAFIERRMWSKAERMRRKANKTPWRRPKRSVIQ